MESRKQSREFRSISGSARVRPGPCRRKPLQRRRGASLRGWWHAAARTCQSPELSVSHAGRPPRTGRVLPPAGRPSECSGSAGPSYFSPACVAQQTPLSMGWMGPRGADPGLAASSGPPRAAMFSADVKPTPPLAEPWAWGRGGLGDWPPHTRPPSLVRTAPRHGFSSGRPAAVLSPCPLCPRCPSSGWPWSRSYTESTPTRVTSGATVSGAGSRGAGSAVLG